MTSKSAFVESLDPNVILSGDIIGMQVDTLGLMCIPAASEPIPEKEEHVSHLRIDTSHKKSSNADYRRCMFKVENDSGERTNIVFGSTVKISHYPTGLVVVGSSVVDEGYKESKMRCVFLNSVESLPTDSLVHKWIVGPRYKLREEGDPVRHNDYVVLRNAQYKQLYLTSFPVRRLDDSEHFTFCDHLLGLGPTSVVTAKPGINIILLRKGTGLQTDDISGATPTTDSMESNENLVISSDYIRVMHREYRGHLIVRTDDETELQSSVMPLGSTTRKRGKQALDNTLGVFLRAFADQQPREQLDFPAAYCSQGVWQVLCTESAQESVSMHSAVKFGTSVRLRHLITGQYLTVRPVEDDDTQKLKEYSSFCIPKQVKHSDASMKSATPTNRDRSRAIAVANSDRDLSPLLPASLVENLRKEKSQSSQSQSQKSKKNGVQINGKDMEIQDPDLLEIKTVDLCVVAILADNLHSSDWTGKHRNSVHMNFSADKGIWEFRTGRSDVPGNVCGWEVDKLNPSAHFKVSEDELKTDFLQVTVYREHMVSGRTPIGTGMAQVSSLVSEFEPGETFDVVVELTDPNSGGPGGTVTVRFCANTLLSKSEYNQLLINTEQAGLSPDRIAAFSSPQPDFPDDESTSTEESEEQAAQDQIGDMLDGTIKLSQTDISTTNWVVGTCSAPDKYTKFNILVVDRKIGDDDFVSYNERFVLEHGYTRQRLKLSTLLGMDSQTTWWEYKSDIPLVPSPFRDGSIIDSEVCQFDRVDMAEIRDILFATRFMQLARAATTALQLTPRPSQLYMPLFRHFHNSLLTLTLWTLGIARSDSTLCAETTTHEEVKRQQRGAGLMKKLVNKLGAASGKLINAVASPERLLQAGSDRVHQGMAMLGLDHSAHPNAAEDVDSDDESYNDSDDENDEYGDGEDDDDIDTDSEDQDDDYGEDNDSDGEQSGWTQAIGLQMGVITPKSKYSALEGAKKRNKKRKKGKRKTNPAATPATTTAADSAAEVAPRHSSLAPWIGRKVPRPVTSNLPASKNSRTPGRPRTPAPLPEIQETPLLKYANEKLDDFVYKDLPINEVLLRRQSILSDSTLLDQIVHFLNILFQLQRAVTLTHDPRMKEQYSCLPQFLLACSVQINKLISACVFKNEKVALKLISVQGSFLAMISQKIQGWDPPIEAILHQTCKNVTKQIPYGSIGPLNSQNDSLLGSTMHKDDGDDALEHQKEEEEDSEVLTPLGNNANTFNIEPILMDAISASDVRQVVEQMHDQHLKKDPSALKILGMLTLLCSSGMAKKYFQNLLVNAIALQDHEDFSLSGDFVQSQRPTSLQTNCVLFFTQFSNKQWEVKFNNPFSFPSLQSKNQEHQRAKLAREGSSLNKLFAHYNTDDNSVLDISECFELLEDLGLGGPFLYKEIRYLESSTIWGFASWWCYRSSFYYPASSISQCQLSPVQAIQVMGEKMTPALMELEMRRTMVSEQAVARELDPLELLNERIAGLCLSYEECFERDKGGLSLVEDYVRSLGGPDTTTTSNAFDYFQTAGDDLFESVKSTGGNTQNTNRFSTLLSARNNQPSIQSPVSTQFQLDPIDTSGKNNAWVEFGTALEDGFEEAAWFRMSLTLLAEICKERNAYTQRIVGSILPAECLMAVLEADSVHYEEKAVLCKLLSNIYVDHRLVFPTRFTPFNTDIVYLGYKEDILNPAITMGKLFNAQSRTRFLGPGSEDGSALRQRLFRHLAQKIKNVQLVSRSRAIISYYSAMLGLFKLLVLKGFLQEPEFGFVATNQTPDDFTDEGSNSNFHTNKTQTVMTIDEKAFTLETVEKLLVQKLNFVLLAQRCTKDFEEICHLDDVLANEQHDALRGKHTPKASFTTKTARRFMRRKKNLRYDGEIEVHPDIAAKHIRSRRTFDTLREKFAYFDVLYADDTMTSVIHSVVEILGYLHDIKQMLRLSRCWNYVVNAKVAMTERAYFQDMTDLEAYVPRLQLSGFLEKLYDKFEPTESVPKYIEAVFSATLYGDNDLRRRSFELLDRQLCLVRDGQHLFDKMHLVSKGHKAFLYRLATVYEEQLMVQVHSVVAQPDPTNAYVLERLTFAIENLRALHFSTFLDRLDAVRSEDDRKSYIRRTSSTVKREAKKLNIDATHFLPDGKPEQDCMTYLMRPIPCPTGPEDFFELEMERLVMEDGAVDALAEHFDLARQTAIISMPEAVIDCEVTMARMGSELIQAMLQLTRAPLFFPWHALFVSEKFLLDQLLSFLAEVAYNSTPLINEWFPQLSEMLITYFPESIGCGKMAISILRRCRSAHTGKDTFSRQILRSIVHHGLVGTALCSSLLVAILQCDDTAAATFAAGFMLSRIQEFTCTFNFRTDPSEMLDNEQLRTQLHNILQPLSLCFSKRVSLPESISSVLKVPLSPEFCKAYLSSECVPLYLKACISSIAIHLYPFQEVSIEIYLLSELRSMRRAFNLDIGLDVEKSMTFCRNFVCQGLLPVLKKRLINSNLFTRLAINTAVIKVIDDVESKDIRNISIAKMISDKFRAHFPTKVPTTSTSTKNRGASAVGNMRSSPSELDDDEAHDGDVSRSFLDLSVFQCVMVLLNVLRLKYGAMSNMFLPTQKADLIFVCTGALMVLSQYPERVVDPLIGEGLRSADFGAMIERLNQIVYGMVTEYISRGVESHISSFYETRLIDAAKSQFRTAAQVAPEKLVRSKSLMFDLRQCFVNQSEADEKSRFSSAMKLAVVFPVEYLLQTPMYKFLANCIEKAASFIDLGGDLLFGDWRSPLVKSKSFAARFTQYTDFDLFLRGEGRYIECMFQYLGRVRQPTDAEYNLLHLLSALLLHKIESIRQSQFLSLNIRLMLVDSETKRLRRLQMTLNNLGAQSFLNIALGNIYNAQTGEPYMWLYAPLVLSFTNEIISWGNRESQHSIMDTISFNISKNKPPEMNALLGLRTLIRRCYLEIAYCTAEPSSESNRMKAGFPDSEHTKILRLVKQLFTFVGTFCKGDNVHAQRFFSAQLGSSKQYVDLVLELCLLTNSILTKFTSMMVYIKSEVFYERLAPLVWDTKDGTKRRFLAWHDSSNNIMLFSQYMYTITHVLDGLLSMCCEGTAGSVQQALNKCPEILEFGGLLQLDVTSKIQGRAFAGISGAGKQVVHWHGGNPFQFYRTYVSLLFASEVGEPGTENDLIVTTLKKWSRGERHRSFLGRHFGSTFDFLKIFGITFSHFEELARQMEEKCLSTMLAYFEVAPVASCTEMSAKFNDGMLMQNMNSTFQKIFAGGTAENDKYASTAVAYVSVLESMGHFFPETQELLTQWEETSLRQGNDPKNVFGVVEIVGKSGRLQRLYFPVPTFVSRFWPYPEVQKMKDLIVMTVNRQSPEEKLADYLQQMVRITTVMKRQERLRSVLTFPLHAFFGGKTTTFSSYLPNQRMLALLLTLALNIYYCYFTSLGIRFEPHDGSALNHWTNWSGMERTMIIVKAVHLGLNGSQTLSRILNSEVTDDLFQTYKQESLVPDLLVKLAIIPVAICYLIQDTFWPICMLTFSFFGLYANKFWLYVPCLFDVAFQFTFMNFLYVAVAMNAGKIWYTLVLAFLCLYFYSVIATLYFTEQYSLDNHSGCHNIVACFKLHLDYGLYNVPDWDNDGYISPVLPLPFVYGTLLARALGTMYNVSYVILINLVLQSIISGLIIDTFSKLREENESVLQDIYDKCFICSINRDEFEQAGIPFRQHIKEQHNMWHYVWFKIYLESKDPLTYSSSENHSAEKMKITQDFLRLIPIKKSLSLIQKRGDDEPDAQLEEKLDILLSSMSKIQTANTKLGKSIVMLRRANARIEFKVNEKTTEKVEV